MMMSNFDFIGDLFLLFYDLAALMPFHVASIPAVINHDLLDKDTYCVFCLRVDF